jgi:hypothetical protein
MPTAIDPAPLFAALLAFAAVPVALEEVEVPVVVILAVVELAPVVVPAGATVPEEVAEEPAI